MGQGKYEREYKVQAVKLAREIGAGNAAQKLGIPVDTLCGWQKAVGEGRLNTGPGSHMPDTAMSLAEELAALRKQVRELEKANRHLKEENEFLAESSAFFRREPSEVSKEQRMRFIAKKTGDGDRKGKLSLLGDGYTEYIKSKIAQEIGKGFVAKADFNAIKPQQKKLEDDLKTRDTQLEELKKATGTADELTAQIAALQEQNKKGKQAHEAEIAQIRLDAAVEKALTDSGARNNTAGIP